MKFSFQFLIILTILVSCDPHKNIAGPKEVGKKEWKSGVKCKIDGKEWESCTAGSFSGHSLKYYTSHYFTFTTANWCQSDTLVIIDIEIKGFLFDTGVYEINKYGEASIGMTDGKDWNFLTDNQHSGKLYISQIDRNQQKFSGSFELEAYDSKNNRTLKITD